MTNEQIETYLEVKQRRNKELSIHFKDRRTVTGIFIEGSDYVELKSKNLWRIVNNARLEEWKQTHDVNLSRIFNGLSFTRLSED
ncbi:MAG TPA: short-chain dehydrogenase [Chitinophagaceae bacterium]